MDFSLWITVMEIADVAWIIKNTQTPKMVVTKCINLTKTPQLHQHWLIQTAN
jgi:hypothetical protein